jgi:CarD family transcriptional regulator
MAIKFSVGDKVIHPKFGAGQITGEEHRELVKGFEHYYVIKIISTGATAYIPMRKMDELGVRPVMSRNKLAQVLKTLSSVPRVLSEDFKKRQECVREQLGTALPIPIAEAVRDLTWHSERKRLTQKDEELLSRGRELLATEMSVATEVQVFDAHTTIDAALQAALASELEGPERVQETNTAVASAPATPA